MKADIESMQNELRKRKEELAYLWKKYPLYGKKYYKDHGYIKNPIPDDIREEYGFIEKRIRNLQININQTMMKNQNQNKNLKT